MPVETLEMLLQSLPAPWGIPNIAYTTAISMTVTSGSTMVRTPSRLIWSAPSWVKGVPTACSALK